MPYDPAPNVFNGSILYFGGTAVGKILSIHYVAEGEKVLITSAEDIAKAFGVSTPGIEVMITVVGGTGLYVTQRETVHIVFNTADDDFDPPDLPCAVVQKIEQSGSKNSAITTEITFVRGRTDEAPA